MPNRSRRLATPSRPAALLRGGVSAWSSALVAGVLLAVCSTALGQTSPPPPVRVVDVPPPPLRVADDPPPVVPQATAPPRVPWQEPPQALVPLTSSRRGMGSPSPRQVPPPSMAATESSLPEYRAGPIDCETGGYRPLPRSRVSVRAEYLMWWTGGNRLPPLVTTSVEGTAPEDSGILGREGTSLLFGDDLLGEGARSGGRFTVGYLLSPDGADALEATYLFLGRGSAGFAAASPEPAILARPYFDAVEGIESALLVAHPDFLDGRVDVRMATDFQAAEVLMRQTLIRRSAWRMELLFGYRFARVNDELNIHQFSEWTVSQGPIPAGTTKDITDRFETVNQFHGGEIGLVYRTRSGRWSLDGLMKIGLGNTHSTVRIDGQTVTTVPDAEPVIFDGGLLAQETNRGSYQSDAFSVLPEVGLTLGYSLTPRLQATFGYTFLYWSQLSRPGDQIDRSVTQLPPEPPEPGGRPRFSRQTSDFWAQGMNFGLEWRF